MTMAGDGYLYFQNIKISDIGDITTGLVVKRKEAELSEYAVKKYKMLTLKSFEQDGWLNTDELEIFQSVEELDKKYLTQKGDVIIRLSYPHTAIFIDKEHEEFVISSLFAIIRLSVEYLLPEYLSIYLNSERMRGIYAKSAIGSAIQVIKTSMLKQITVKFPDLERQKKIIELNRLMIKEKILLTRLIEEKIKYNKEAINKLITGGERYGS